MQPVRRSPIALVRYPATYHLKLLWRIGFGLSQ
jgi:hypothetical protein